MKIFAFSGLGADERVFQFLELDYPVDPVFWLSPLPQEYIRAYSKRLMIEYNIEKEDDFGLLGVSFGGLIATEISKISKPKFTVLISSVSTDEELSDFFKLIGKSRIAKLLSAFLFHPPAFLADYLFGAKNKALLQKILQDTDPYFAKWAVQKLLTWQNRIPPENLLKISGSKDKLLPSTDKQAFSIAGGGHFMIVDKAAEVSFHINFFIKNKCP